MGLPHVTAIQVVPSTVSEISKDICDIVAALKVKLHPLTGDPFENQNFMSVFSFFAYSDDRTLALSVLKDIFDKTGEQRNLISHIIH